MTHAKVENSAEILDRLISDYGPSKYQDIVRAMQWARHLRRQEEFRLVPMAELIERSLLDVVDKKVTVPEIEKAVKEDQAMEEKLLSKRADRSHGKDPSEPRASKEA
ncbi:MAG TPA: hypothetical protein DCZ92_06585 [Elusimicrobia bacterium]|nr:MAG: hypothetical protein A2016_06600 [Elusimicrobia bacterium GWF2_62_30]HBA60473.1 hypothetical protein [Elusimicrobiota bacterium]